MSSLAAARADNFYYDPERFDPKKRGRDSVNALANSHPLGDRAKRLKTEGILVIRFEMPHDCWCNKCKKHVGRGVRFNADKKKVGAYFTTTIWEFSMKCPSGCGETFVIRTNPKESDYDFVSGATRRSTDPDDPSEAGMLVLESQNEDFRKRIDEEPLFSMERKLDDKLRASRQLRELAALGEESSRKYGKDRMEVQSKARSKVRNSRKEKIENQQRGEMAGFGSALGRELPQDQAVAEDAFRQAKLMGINELVDENPNFLLQGLEKNVKKAMGRTVFDQPLIQFVPGGTTYSSMKQPAETINFISKQEDSRSNSANALYSQFVKPVDSSTSSLEEQAVPQPNVQLPREPARPPTMLLREQERLLAQDIFSKRFTSASVSESNLVSKNTRSSKPSLNKTQPVNSQPLDRHVLHFGVSQAIHSTKATSPGSTNSPRNQLVEVLEKRNTRRPAHLPPERKSLSSIIEMGLAKQKHDEILQEQRLKEEKKRVSDSFRNPTRMKAPILNSNIGHSSSVIQSKASSIATTGFSLPKSKQHNMSSMSSSASGSNSSPFDFQSSKSLPQTLRPKKLTK